MSRQLQVAAIGVLVLIILVVAVISQLGGGQLSPQDKALKRSATTLLSDLKAKDARYAAVSDPLQSFDLFQHDQQDALVKHMGPLTHSGQFAQIQVWETGTMPPQSLLLRDTSKPNIALSSKSLSDAVKGSTFTTVQEGNLEFRAYLTPMTVPATMKALGTHEILEVFHVISG